jgi:hypothetical protein
MKTHVNIVFDFDGVICDQIRPYDPLKFGTPNLEMIKLIRKLHRQGHHLKLSTARLCPFIHGKPDQNVIKGRTLNALTHELSRLGILHCFGTITGYKPYGDVYVDDRALWFDGSNHKDIETIIEKIIRDNNVSKF